jgi:HK97 family phage prohead protease
LPGVFTFSEGAPMNFRQKNTRCFTANAVLDGFKAAEDGIIHGYASTFGDEPDTYGDVIAPGAFTRSLADHKSRGTLPALLWSHRQDQPIGKWTAMREDARGLIVEGAINLKTSAGRDAWEHMKAGDAGGLSIGYRVPDGGEERQRDGSNLLRQIDLHEVSVVVIPANRNSRVTSLKMINSKADVIDILRGAGVPIAAAKKIAAGGYPALPTADHQKAMDLIAQIDAATAKIRSL